MTICFKNAQIFQPEGFVPGELYVKNGKIVAAEPAEKVYDCQEFFLCPGLIDLQVNGIQGHDFTTSLDDLESSSRLLAANGVTSFLATIISQPLRRYREIFKSFHKSATCLGLHLEGPHLNPHKRGAHPFNAISETCDVEFWKEHIDPNVVKMVTVAPESKNSTEFIEFLTSKGIVVACGHTEATFDEVNNAKLHGLTHATHLFNAMQQFHQRSPGIIGYVLGQKKLSYSLIVDGVHLHPDTVAMAYNAYPDGLILVSDSSARTLAGHTIDAKSGKKVLSGTDTIAGSSCTLLDAVNLLHKQTTCSFHYAVKAATQRPAELLGLTTKGQLLEGYDADLTILDERGECCRTFLGGKQIFP
ncbi:MAG: N-acetylglucosamine-6-phosphate deacetylase [Verrucomicrobia bacterium]|nr:N-acetylglucosamine-6-phosphate deacetylase [Verrucomicrobiota bacterium]